MFWSEMVRHEPMVVISLPVGIFFVLGSGMIDYNYF
jgi:hypothetical protein